MALTLLSDLVDDYRKRALLAAFSFKDLLYRFFAFLLTTSLVLWLSIFGYISFYYSYVPAISHIRPVHLEFSSCPEQAGLCSFPSANVTLTHQHHLLKEGQAYNIILDLDLPESEKNKQLGMFMVQLKLTGKDGKLVAQSRRSAMLRYKSYTLQLLSTVMFSPLLLAGPLEEKQTLKVVLFNDFLEDLNYPVTNLWVELETRWLELYSANLRIQADFTGLRYFMFYWPGVTATIAIVSNVIILSIIVAYTWFRLLKPNQVVVRVGLGAGRNSNAIGNNGGNSANNSALSVSPSMPAMASLESSPSGETSAKTIEQRRSEARERLFKDRSRKVSESSNWSETARIRSASMSMIQRVQELPSRPPPTVKPPDVPDAAAASAAAEEEEEGIRMHKIPVTNTE